MSQHVVVLESEDDDGGEFFPLTHGPVCVGVEERPRGSLCHDVRGDIIKGRSFFVVRVGYPLHSHHTRVTDPPPISRRVYASERVEGGVRSS